MIACCKDISWNAPRTLASWGYLVKICLVIMRCQSSVDDVLIRNVNQRSGPCGAKHAMHKGLPHHQPVAVHRKRCTKRMVASSRGDKCPGGVSSMNRGMLGMGTPPHPPRSRFVRYAASSSGSILLLLTGISYVRVIHISPTRSPYSSQAPEECL